MIASTNDCLPEYKAALSSFNRAKYPYLIINNSPSLPHPHMRICTNLFKEDPKCPYPKFTVL